jgi:hypothetical protein
MEMRRKIQAGAEFLDERDGSTLHVCVASLLGFGFVPALNHSQEYREHIRDELFVVGHPISDFDRQAQNPLPYRDMGKYVVHQVSSGVGHASAHAT